ncbi:uncharacterized protein [Periplaneta americana]|uniref:uncharacterized protein n=1 Tax=Periplaneta americana TaxID=6978 RepID=UPI0037E95E9A
MNCVEMDGMSEAKPIQQPRPCLLLVSPWQKRRNIFTVSTSGKPPLLTYPLGENPIPLMPNRIPLRIVRLAPFSSFVGPRFPNPLTFNGGVPSPISSSPGQMFSLPSSAETVKGQELYENLLQQQQQQQQWQPPEDQVTSGHNTFPPEMSTVSDESNVEEVAQTNNQLFTRESNVSDCNRTFEETDHLLNVAAEPIGYAKEEIIPSDELQNVIMEEISLPVLDSASDYPQLQLNYSENENERSDNTTSNDNDDALAAIYPHSLTNENIPFRNKNVSLESSAFSLLEKDVNTTLGTRIKVADDKQEEVVKAAKSLFSKRTRTLYHWLYPDTSKNKLKATVSAAWDSLPDNEKHFYISQVLGRFGLQASSLMINPQLDGMKDLPTNLTSSNQNVSSKEDEAAEAARAVEDLFASCDDADKWASYPRPKRRNTNERRRKRKSTRSPNYETGGRARLGPVDPDEMDEETAILKRMRESKLEPEFEEDLELSSELEKFRLISESGAHYKDDDDDDDFWRRTPDPDELFSQMDI